MTKHHYLNNKTAIKATFFSLEKQCDLSLQ